jgi:hypothetical protein
MLPLKAYKNIILERRGWCTIPNTKISERKRRKPAACK